MFNKSKKQEKQEEKELKKKEDDWMTKKWRPMMAMMYMICCLCDFALFPIMFTIVQFWETAVQNDAFRQWVPITLQGGGLFHVAMGAVLGVSAFGRTQEKIAGAAGAVPAMPAGLPAVNLPTPGGSNNGFNVPTSGPATPSFPQAGGFGSPSPSFNTGFGAPSGFNSNPGFGAPAYGSGQPAGADFGAPAGVTVGFGGKKAPPEFPQPLI
jgi:hypothetical protein